MLIGSVAKLLSGARMVPTMPAVATNTVLLPPASACVTASPARYAGRGDRPRPRPRRVGQAPRSTFLPKGIRVERIFVSAGPGNKPVRGAQIRSAAHPDGGSPPNVLALGATHRSG